MITDTTKIRSRVIAINQLSQTGYEILLERNGLSFVAGQLINVHGRNHLEDRSYTVCSGEHDEHLTVLFRYIPSGKLTPQLVDLKPGNHVYISGPYGEFTIRDHQRPIMFFATGTGVAPCRAFLRSYPDLAITLFHGVRYAEDLFYREEFSKIAYRPCVSRQGEALQHTPGRITDLARIAEFTADSHFYLCGANEMIYEMQEILGERDFDNSSVFTEAYYYRFDES
jgi:ferredoxin--NADP+ reductase